MPAPLPPPVTAPITAPVVAAPAASLAFLPASLSWRIVPFGILHRGFFGARSIVDRASQHHGIAAGIDHRSEMNQQFGAPFDVSATLHAHDLSLNVGPGGNHDALIDHEGKSGFGVDRIALPRGLRRNCLLKGQRNLRPAGNRERRLEFSGRCWRRCRTVCAKAVAHSSKKQINLMSDLPFRKSVKSLQVQML